MFSLQMIHCTPYSWNLQKFSQFLSGNQLHLQVHQSRITNTMISTSHNDIANWDIQSGITILFQAEHCYILSYITWWRHQMEIFSALLAICAGNSPVTGEFPAHRPVTRCFDIFFDLRLNTRLSKQWWCWWFETPLWRHSNETFR